MKKSFALFLFSLLAWEAFGQVPSVTTSSKIRFVEGNTIFDRTVADVLDLVGGRNITVTGNWTFSSNLTQLKDAGTYFYDDGDNTKQLRFQLSGITTATTRNLTVPNADGTIALTGAAYGGTGQSAVAQGDLLYGSATDTWSRLAKDANATRYLSNTGSSNNPAWAQVNLTNGVTGTLPVGSGGTGATTFSSGQILYGNGTSALSTSSALSYSSSVLQVDNSASGTGVLGGASDEAIRLQNTNSTNNNWSWITSYTQTGVVDAGIGFQHIDHSTREAAVSIYAYGGGAFPRMARFHYNGITLDRAVTASSTLAVTSTSTFTGGITCNGGLTVNTVAPVINTNLSIGSSSVGSLLTVWNDYSSTSPASSAAYSAILLKNRNATANNWNVIEWDSQTNAIAADFGVQYLDHTNDYADLVMHTRGSSTGFGEAFRVTSEKLVGIGVFSSLPARLTVRGSGTTSATTSLVIENSAGTDVFTVRDDQMSAFGTTPVSTEKLTVRGATSDNTTKAFVAERANGTDVLGVQNDGKVSINNAAYTEELTINGQAQMDNLVLNNQTGSNVATGNITYTDDATYGGYLTLGDGDRQLSLMPTMIERLAVDYNTNWTTGRTKAFWTVPARFNGWKVSKVYVEVSSIGSGAGDDQVEIEKGGVALNTLTVTAATHTVTLDNTLATDDIFTFDIVALSATPAKGLNISLELSKN